jgi:RNA polymerase sigma factor for flagellar operon FliA
MAVLAEELGVSDSRLSQMRSEALVLLRDAINAQLDPELVPEETSPRVAARRATYHASVAEWHTARHRRRARPGSRGEAEVESAVA